MCKIILDHYKINEHKIINEATTDVQLCTRKEKDHSYSFYKKEFKASISFCVDEKYLDNFQDREFSLLGRIEAKPSKRNNNQFKVYWRTKGVLNLPKGFKGNWLKTLYDHSFETFFKEQISDYEELIAAASGKEIDVIGDNEDSISMGYFGTKIRTQKIRIWPNPLQKKKFEDWLECNLATYNLLVQRWPSCENPPSKDAARAYIKECNKDTNNQENYTPYDIQECALEDFLEAAKAQKSKKKENRHYSAIFHQRASVHQCSIEIRPRQWKSHGTKSNLENGYGFFGPDKSFGENILRSKYHLPVSLDHACLIKKHCNGKWFLYLRKIIYIERQQPTLPNIDSAVALDPGIRTFMTSYSCHGVTTEWAVDDYHRLHGLHYKIDELQSLIDTKKGLGMLVFMF